MQLPVLVKCCRSSMHRAQDMVDLMQADMHCFITTGSCTPLHQTTTGRIVYPRAQRLPIQPQ